MGLKENKTFRSLSKNRVLYSVGFATIFAWLYFSASVFRSREELKVPAIKNNSLLYQTTPSRDMKYVLIWTSHDTYPFKLLQTGQKAFIEAGCDITECHVTSDQTYLKNLSNFNAVLFHGPEKWSKPLERSPKQKYVFATVESAHNYPVCDRDAEGFFNWTWTYKLDSPVPWSAITIRNLEGEIVGPKKKMTWINDTQPIGEGLTKTFAKRRKAAAWFVSNCLSKSAREEYVTRLKKSLRAYGLKVDIFGSCGLRTCPMVKQTEKDCDHILQRDYYFYLAFENSFSEDYVTEKVLHGYRNHVVPVVIGSANYTRFLPPNSYLDAYRMNATALAQAIHKAIHTPEIYHQFFRWTNHYTVEDSGTKRDSNPFCLFCAALHDPKRMDRVTVCNNLLRWWNGKHFKRICELHFQNL